MVLKKIRTYIVSTVVIAGLSAALIYGLNSGGTMEVKRELHNSSQISTPASLASTSDALESCKNCGANSWKPLYTEEYVKTKDAVMEATVTCEICGENLGGGKMRFDEYGVKYWTCTSEQLSHIKACFFKYCDDNSLDPYSQAVDIKTSSTDYSWTPAAWEKRTTSTFIGYECSKCGYIILAE